MQNKIRNGGIAMLLSAGIAAAVFAGNVATANVPAAVLKDSQAYTVSVDGRTAVIYFTQAEGQYKVVSTAAQDDDAGAPLRTIHTLNDGQTVALQLSSEGKGTRIVLTRDADLLQVQAPTQVASAE